MRRLRKLFVPLCAGIVWALFQLGVFHGFLLLERRFGWRRSVVCLCYHSINGDANRVAISGMEAGTRDTDLDAQLTEMLKWYEPIDDRQLASWLEHERPLVRDGLLVTFDDGYLDNLEVAGPILRKHKVPGLIFLATAYIDTPRHYWWSRLSEAMRNINPDAWKSLTTAGLPAALTAVVEEESLDAWQSRVRARQRFAAFLDRSTAIEEVLQQLESRLDAPVPLTMPLLNWRQIQSMASDGFRFGGHSHTHPWLSQLSDQEIRDEVSACHAAIQRNLGVAPLSFAYPAGDYDERVLNVLLLSDFQLSFMSNGGVIREHSSAYALPRLEPRAQGLPELYRSMVAWKLAKYLSMLPVARASWCFSTRVECASS